MRPASIGRFFQARFMHIPERRLRAERSFSGLESRGEGFVPRCSLEGAAGGGDLVCHAFWCGIWKISDEVWLPIQRCFKSGDILDSSDKNCPEYFRRFPQAFTPLTRPGGVPNLLFLRGNPPSRLQPF